MKIPREFSHPVRIGQGSFSTVYRAYQRTLERPVVLKSLPLASPRESGKVKREVRVLASLRLPCVPQIYDVIRMKKNIMIVMEWVRGIPLSFLMERTAASDDLSALATSLIESLALLHGNNVVHGDLKPENILVTADMRIFFIDFGFSLLHRNADRPSGVIQGTPAFMAPELWSSRDTIDYKKVDVYALGVLLGRLLGKAMPPFAAELTSSDPAGRPDDCALFEQTWRARMSPMADTQVLRSAIGSAVEEYIAHLLLAGARELHGKGRDQEAYALLTESLDAWPDNAEALDYLQNKFSTPLSASAGKKKFFAAAAGFAVASALLAAYFIGVHSSASPDIIGALSVLNDEPRVASLLSSPRGRLSSSPSQVALREIGANMDLTGTIVVMGFSGKGSLIVDNNKISVGGQYRVALTLPIGTHRVEWIDFAANRRCGETIELLPFEKKTVSLQRFINGPQG
jgi:serine/threonine protein kinase